MLFNWIFKNNEHLTDEQQSEIELAFERRAYVCQRRIEEKEYDGTPQSIIGDSINVLFDAIDEAYVTEASVCDDTVDITLDFSQVRY